MRFLPGAATLALRGPCTGPARGEDAVIETTATIEIDRDPEEVFDYLSDFSRNPEWQSGMTSCEWTSEPPVEVGSTYEQQAKFLGRTLTNSFEVVALEPGRSITISSTDGTFPITVTRAVEPLPDGGSRVSATVEGDPSGVFRLAEPVLRRMVRRSVAGDYRRLKGILES